MKEVIFCTDGIFPHSIGGMQRHSKLLIEQMSKDSNLELIVVHPHKETVFDVKTGVKEVSIEGIDESKNYLKECYHYSKRVSKVLDEYPNAIIYSQGLSVWYKVKKYGERLIINPHGLEPFQTISIKDKLISIPFRLIFRKIFKRARFVVSLGGELTEILKKNVKNQKIYELPNAVNLPNEKIKGIKNQPEKLEFLFVARFASNKGIHILMDAIDKLNRLGYNDKIFFHLCGKGPLYDDYVKNHQKENVKFWGFVSDDDLRNLYETVDVFCFPTLFEGMPTVVLEAMSYKLPVIVSNTGATAVLVDENNGYLIEKNNVDALFDAITAYVDLGEEQKNKLAENSLSKVEEFFTWQKVAKRHLELFNSIN